MKQIRLSVHGYRKYKYYDNWKSKGLRMVGDKVAKGGLSRSNTFK